MSLNVITVKLFLYSKNRFLKNLCSGIQCGGFQFLLILDLWGISFHAVIVFGLGRTLYLNLFQDTVNSQLKKTREHVDNLNKNLQTHITALRKSLCAR